MKALALIVAVAISLSGCTTMQEAVSGGAAGGVAGFALAGPMERVSAGTAALS